MERKSYKKLTQDFILPLPAQSLEAILVSQSLVFLLVLVLCQGDHELNYSIAGLLGQFRKRRWLGRKENLKNFQKVLTKVTSQKYFRGRSFVAPSCPDSGVDLSQCRQEPIL